MLLLALAATLPARANDLPDSCWSETAASNTCAVPNGLPANTLAANLYGVIHEIMGALKLDWDRANPTVTSTGTNTIALSYAVAPAAYVQGDTFSFIAGGTNTGAASLNVNGLGAKAITKRGTTALTGNEILSGEAVIVQYDGTEFQLVSVGASNSAFTGGALTSLLSEAKGTDIASAATTNLCGATGNFVHITGTTTITGLGSCQAGTRIVAEFTGALTLSYNATSLILPGAANIATKAGDTMTAVSEGSGNWRVIHYSSTSNLAVVSITRQTFTSSGTYTPHAGMLYCLVRLQAPGGGSGGTAATTTGNLAASGGGGAGGYAERLLTAAQIGASQTVTIGAVGTAGTAGNNAGGTGGTTSLGALLSATGGVGGSGSAAGTTATSAGGAGGGGSSGDINISGNAGSPGWFEGSGQNLAAGGSGGPSPAFGGGVAGPVAAGGTFTAGTAGKNYGAGASGNASDNVSQAAAAGAAGGPGIIDVTEFNSQ